MRTERSRSKEPAAGAIATRQIRIVKECTIEQLDGTLRKAAPEEIVTVPVWSAGDLITRRLAEPA